MILGILAFKMFVIHGDPHILRIHGYPILAHTDIQCEKGHCSPAAREGTWSSKTFSANGFPSCVAFAEFESTVNKVLQ